MANFVITCVLLLLAVATTIHSSGYNYLQDTSAATREVINFDFAWRHYSAPVEGSQYERCSGSFIALTNETCSGVRSVGNYPTADDCRALCCLSRYCRGWVYTPATRTCNIDGETEFSCGQKEPGAVGGMRAVPAEMPELSSEDVKMMQTTFDDSEWEIVDAPHDSLIAGNFSVDGPPRQGNLPYRMSYYRKHFNLPSDWQGKGQTSVYFEGIFRSSYVFLNGVQIAFHESGYTSFSVRLDNVTGVKFGEGKENENVLAIRAQAFGGSGWWYEGGGLYRHNYLVHHENVYISPNGVLGKFFVDLYDDMPSGIKKHVHVADSELKVETTVIFDDSSTKGIVGVEHTLYDEKDKQIAVFAANDTWMQAGQEKIFLASQFVRNASLWSPTKTHLYRIETRVIFQNQTVDSVNDTYIGATAVEWLPKSGYVLNRAPLKWRGYCNHNSLAGVGVAVPDRMNLFRAQSMKSIGGNAWRTSHNPPVPGLLNVLDRVGILVWDETRNFGDEDQWATDMRDMVQRDRNHPSVMLWSFCNEAGCLQQNPNITSIGGQFRGAAKSQDPYRPVSANMMTYSKKLLFSGLTGELDVQGFSHMPGFIFDDFHMLHPNMAILNSECCSCVTQRGEQDVTPEHLSNFNADCVSEQTLRGISRRFVSGVMVWTLFDYIGEPTPIGWPHVSSSFGSFDLAGFSKAAAYWYRAWWLYNFTHNANTSFEEVDAVHHLPSLIDPEDALGLRGKDNGEFLVHIVQNWEANTPDTSATARTIQVYTNAPMVELHVNSKSVGTKSIQWYGWAEFGNITFEAGNLTAVALSSSGTPLANHTRLTASNAMAIRLALDVPSVSTGTGQALVLDGQDTGMIRAMVVDSHGTVVPSSSHRITFNVSSGPGRIIGVGNGDPACHENNKASTRSAYHGLARAIVQVSINSAMPQRVRHRLAQIDSESGKYTVLVNPGDEEKYTFSDGIVVSAASLGLTSATITIPVTNDIEQHNVLATASSSMIQK